MVDHQAHQTHPLPTHHLSSGTVSVVL